MERYNNHMEVMLKEIMKNEHPNSDIGDVEWDKLVEWLIKNLPIIIEFIIKIIAATSFTKMD